ncbi:vancomycin high temperature exclusion protein [Phormidesmis sp. 146-12]
MNRLKPILKNRILLLSLAIGTLILPLLLMQYVSFMTRSDRYNAAKNVPVKPVAIVFGAGIYTNGTPTPMLADRVQGGVDLYRQGRVRKLLMTGDNSATNYDEVTAMKRYAITLGIPEKDITLDYAGFSTYESCYRAKAIFGVTQSVLVTQHYHLPRAVYTCRQLGIDAIGLGTPDWESYGNQVMVPYALREIASTMKATLQVHLLHPKPTFLGQFEGIR